VFVSKAADSITSTTDWGRIYKLVKLKLRKIKRQNMFHHIQVNTLAGL